jgi:hypothetical protein
LLPVWKLYGTEGDEHFGYAVAILGDTIMIGAPGRDAHSTTADGAVDVYTIDEDGTPTYAYTLTPEDADVSGTDHFGQSIAMVDSVAVVGAPGHDEGGTNAGAAYVFTCSDGVYSDPVQLLPSGDLMDAFYGTDVDVDGDLIVVGAPGQDDHRGAAYLYDGSGGSWSLAKRLRAYDGESVDMFGYAVAVFDAYGTPGDDWVMVGAPYDDNWRGEDAGAVYAFRPVTLEFEHEPLPMPPGMAAMVSQMLGSFAGGKAKMPSGDWVAVIWEEIDGQWQHYLLPDLLGGGSQVNALATAQDQEIWVGGTALELEGYWQPVIWNRVDGQWVLTVLPKPVDAVSGEVLSMNEDTTGRLIATGSTSVPEGLQVATMWTRVPGQEWIVGVLPPLAPDQDTVACDFIESDGPIVIGHARDPFDGLRAVIWDKNGPIWQIAPLPNLPGGLQSAAFGGTSGATPIIAGWSETDDGNRHAVSWMLEDGIWRPSNLCPSGMPGCMLNSQAIASAWPDDWEMPWLCGFADDGPDTAQAMLWLDSGSGAEAINLNDVIEDEWIIRRATSISQSGRIAAWGVQPGAEDEPRAFIVTVSSESSCFGDLDGDGDVDLGDLAMLLAHYGATSGAAYEDGDLDGDEDVDLGDLAALLVLYGTTCD